MKIKNISLALGLLLALPSIGLISCGKKKEGYTVKVSVTDIGTAKAYRDLEGNGGSKLNSNANGAKITSVKVTYIDERGKKVEDKIQNLEVGKDFLKTYQVAAGKTIIVTAAAEGSPVADITQGKMATKKLEEIAEDLKELNDLEKVKEKVKEALKMNNSTDKPEQLEQALEKLKEALNQSVAKDVKALTKAEQDKLKGTDGKALEEAVKAVKEDVANQPTEVTLPTLSITIEKGGETIAAQSVKASKSSLKPEELTMKGQKTTVTATATAVAFDVK